jgi:hypothetical protein
LFNEKEEIGCAFETIGFGFTEVIEKSEAIYDRRKFVTFRHAGRDSKIDAS